MNTEINNPITLCSYKHCVPHLIKISIILIFRVLKCMELQSRSLFRLSKWTTDHSGQSPHQIHDLKQLSTGLDIFNRQSAEGRVAAPQPTWWICHPAVKSAQANRKRAEHSSCGPNPTYRCRGWIDMLLNTQSFYSVNSTPTERELNITRTVFVGYSGY